MSHKGKEFNPSATLVVKFVCSVGIASLRVQVLQPSLSLAKVNEAIVVVRYIADDVSAC